MFITVDVDEEVQVKIELVENSGLGPPDGPYPGWDHGRVRRPGQREDREETEIAVEED